jgi:polysaccharide pyruvyl transferase WcaK-like protein
MRKNENENKMNITYKLVIPPTPDYPGSLGDKAILLSINTKDADLAVADTSSPFWQNLNFDNVVNINNLEVNKYDEVHLYPTDVIDGAFGSGPVRVFEKVTNLFKNSSAKIFFNSFSYGPSPIKESVEYIKITNAIYSLRDEYSLQRFKNFFPNHISFLKPDPAFNLEIKKPNKEILLPKNPVAICPAKYEYDKYSKIVEQCIKKGYNPILVLHDLRPHVGDIDLCNKLSKNYTLPIMPTQDPREIKYYLSKMNFVITGRMHVAILSMGTDTKVYGFDYNNKMKGTFKVKNQENNVIQRIEEMYEI